MRKLALGDNIGDRAAAAAAGKKTVRLNTSQLPSWLGSADRAHEGVSGRSEDATCSMLHSCFVKPRKAKLSPLVDYGRGERLVRGEAETEGSDRG